jgi:uncharacterized protein (DUF58 family)
MTPSPALRIPDARQGTGTIAQQLVEELELVIAHRTAGVMPGDRRAAGVGTGTELAQLRPYVPGDDVRHIDPAATARTGEPHVRVHVPERTLTTWILLDLSPSMAFGTASRLKSDVAEGVALVVARLAVRRAGRVALMTFGAGPRRLLPPHSSRRGLTAIRTALDGRVAADGTHEPRALADALLHVRKLARQPGLVVVISDLREQNGWTAALATLRARHSILVVEPHDPRERELPPVGHLTLVDPETGEHVVVDTSRPELREAFARIEADVRADVARELRRLRVDHAPLSTHDDWFRDLGRKLR